MSTDLLEMRGICKAFPGVQALWQVDFGVGAGEVHALMGENGAGKSTLIKVLTGVYPRDAGTVALSGVRVAPRSTREAEMCGISTVYQEVNLIPHLSVAENICLGRQPMRLRSIIDWRGVRRRAEAALARLGLALDVTRPLNSCSVAFQQMVALARALDVDARLLVLDEPTSSLDEKEVEELFLVIRRLRDEGLGIVFITHFLDQVYRVADRITVLRDGRRVGTFEARDLPRLELVGKMIGKDPGQVAEMERRHAVAPPATGEPFLAVEGLGRSGAVENVRFQVRPGEIVGLAGLLGSGRTETARLLYGIDRPDHGTIRVDGTVRRITSPRKAIRLRFAMTSEDRKISGTVPNLSVRENIVLALQARKGVFRRLPRRRQAELADRFIEALGIKTPGREQNVGNLSGGNQQKVLLSRWLVLDPRLLILDEPTRGIDVGAKAEIERLMQELCGRGMAILFISSELEEVVRDSHRVVVLRDGRQVGEIPAEKISLHEVMRRIAEHTHA